MWAGWPLPAELSPTSRLFVANLSEISIPTTENSSTDYVWPVPAAAWFNPAVLLNEVEYARPESVGEALELVEQHDNARALAGVRPVSRPMSPVFGEPA